MLIALNYYISTSRVSGSRTIVNVLFISGIDSIEPIPIRIVGLIQGIAMASISRLRILLDWGRVAIRVEIGWGLVGLIGVEIN